MIIWDGGNNDLPQIEPDLDIVLVDPHRPGHERTYFPGEANLLRAQIILITKTESAEPHQVAAAWSGIRQGNPFAIVIESAMPISADRPKLISGKRVLVIEDGPTLTHGGMAYGAGTLAAKAHGAAELVDPRPQAVGSIREAFAHYPHMGPLLPALGYGEQQIHELEETVRRTECDAVLIATPVDLRRIMKIEQPACRIEYRYANRGEPTLDEIIAAWIEDRKLAG